jgi:hypothetical protein
MPLADQALLLAPVVCPLISQGSLPARFQVLTLVPLLYGALVTSFPAMAAVLGIMVAWPTLAQKSYLSHRTAAMAFLRLLIVLLPFKYEARVQDMLLQDVDTGRFAWASNASRVLMGEGQRRQRSPAWPAFLALVTPG